MCLQCIVNPLYFGAVLPGWILIRARRGREGDMDVGDWGLVECNDPSFVWKTTPKPDPLFGMDDETYDAAWSKFSKEEKNAYYDREGDFLDAFECNPNTGYKLVKAAMEKGYDREKHGQFESWFFHYLGEWIRDNEPTVDSDPFPDLDNYEKHDYTIWKD